MTVNIRYLGHSSFQIKTEKLVIYIDLRKYGGVVETTEKADIVLVTHNHADHFSSEKVERVRKTGTVIIAPKNCASRIGGEIDILKADEELPVGNINVRAVEAYNIKRFKPSGKPWHPKGYGVGYLITVDGKTIYHAGDTDFVPEMKELGHVDVALIPIGDKYTMDTSEATKATTEIRPNVVIPMHCWDKNPKEFKKEVEKASKAKVIVLEKGEEYQLD